MTQMALQVYVYQMEITMVSSILLYHSEAQLFRTYQYMTHMGIMLRNIDALSCFKAPLLTSFNYNPNTDKWPLDQ